MNKLYAIVGIALLSVSLPTGAAAAGDVQRAPGIGDQQHSQHVIVVVGAAGESQYGRAFHEWAKRWQQVAEQSGASHDWLGAGDSQQAETAANAGADTDRQRLRELLQRQQQTKSDQPLWVVLIGHGTFAADVAKFNLEGPDVAAEELAEWIAPLQRPLVVVNCASASGPFINRLSGDGRTIVTATQSGAEQNYARFGEYLSRAIGDAAADLDHDDAVSILEAYLHAAARTAQFYEAQGRLATEHPLIDDNGDQLGTPSDFFQGVRAVRTPKENAAVDGSAARRQTLFVLPGVPRLSEPQRAERAELEQQLEQLRTEKPRLGEQAYYDRLEPLMVRLAEIYRAAEGEAKP